jgi:hypothetical protein
MTTLKKERLCTLVKPDVLSRYRMNEGTGGLKENVENRGKAGCALVVVVKP